MKYYKLPHKSAILPAKFLNLQSPLVGKAFGGSKSYGDITSLDICKEICKKFVCSSVSKYHACPNYVTIGSVRKGFWSQNMFIM